jgi:hypothetical protein
MSAAEHLTWDGDGDDESPRRPSTDDLGGDQKQDDAEYPPDPVEHYTAGGWNQIVRQLAALAKVTAAAKLEVRFDSGAPYIARVSSPRSDVEIDTFTVVDNGDGDVSVTWPADTFPPHACSPTGLTLISSASAVVDGHVEEITNGIRVRTRSGGSATNVPWTITIN